MWFRKPPGLKSSLAQKLILLFLFASLYPFSLITFMGYNAMRDVVRKDTLDELRSLALAGESALVAHLTSRRAALMGAAEELRRLGTTAGEVSRLLEVWRPRLEAEELEVLNLDGPAKGGPSLEAASSTPSQVGIRAGAQVWEASAPIDDKTLLTARWPLAELARSWRQLAGPRGRVTVSLVGSDGVIVADSGGLARGRPIPSEVLSRLREGSLGDLAYRSATGRLVLGVASGKEIGRLLGAPWTVVVEEDTAWAFRPVEMLRHSVMRFGLVMLILFTLIAALFARTVMRPIEQLTEGARVLGRGQLDHRLTVMTGDEIEQLAREFNSMAAELQESYASLEEKIAKATADLREHMEKLAEERNKIDGILRSLTDGIIVTDRNRCLMLANPVAEALFSFRLEQAAGREVMRVLSPEPVQSVMSRLLDRPEPEASEEVEFTPPGAEGPRVYLAHKAAVHDRRGETLGVVTLFNDVTPFRELDRMKSEFLSLASHELRTPLISIQGFSELLMMRKLEEDKREKFLGYINTQAKRLGNLISDFLDMARIEAGRGFELVLEPLALEPLVRSCVEIFESRNIPHSFVVDVDEGLPQVVADQAKMEHVFQNLLGNAVKYSPDGGTLRVSASQRREAVLIEVADEGVGMTPEQVDHVFDKFYRVDASSSGVEGTGLGMFIVKSIVEAHNGAIWVESEVGRGTRVFVTLPCPEATGPAVQEPVRKEPTSGRAV